MLGEQLSVAPLRLNHHADFHQSLVQSLADFQQSLVQRAVDFQQSLVQSVAAFHQSLVQSVAAFRQSLVESVAAFHQSLVESLAAFYQSLVQSVADFHQSLVQSLADFHQSLVQTLEASVQLGNLCFRRERFDGALKVVFRGERWQNLLYAIDPLIEIFKTCTDVGVVHRRNLQEIRCGGRAAILPSSNPGKTNTDPPEIAQN